MFAAGYIIELIPEKSVRSKEIVVPVDEEYDRCNCKYVEILFSK